MSLPSPTTGGAFPSTDPSELEAMDVPLVALASKCGDLRRLLYAFFSFLHRRTDFYMIPNEEDLKEGVPLKMGFREGDAENLLLAAFRQFPLRRMPRQGGGKVQIGAKTANSGSSQAASTVSSKAAPKGKEGLSKASMPHEEEEKSGDETQVAASSTADSLVGKNKARQNEAEKSMKQNDELSMPLKGTRYTDEGKQIPVGNGGATARYRWTQTLDETSVIIPVPEGTRGKDLDVSLQPTSISIRMKKSASSEDSSKIILQGDLVDKIRTDESTWSLEGGVLLLTLDKLKKTWWKTVIAGDDEIDTTLVDSRRNIGEYDEATQGAIRKILFDQRQERLGLPTSDEILGKKPKIPPLPTGVEYIDKSTLEEKTSGKRK